MVDKNVPIKSEKVYLSQSGRNFRGEDITPSNKQTFWDSYCKQIPDDGKVGDYIKENEILVLDIDSVDIWLGVKLVMT